MALHGSYFLSCSDRGDDFLDFFTSSQTNDVKNFFSLDQNTAEFAKKKVLATLRRQKRMQILDEKFKRTRKPHEIKADKAKAKKPSRTNSHKIIPSILSSSDNADRSYQLSQNDIGNAKKIFRTIDPQGFTTICDSVKVNSNYQALAVKVLQENQSKLLQCFPDVQDREKVKNNLLKYLKDKVEREKTRDRDMQYKKTYQANIKIAKEIFSRIDPTGFRDTKSVVLQDANPETLATGLWEKNQEKLKGMSLDVSDALQIKKNLNRLFKQERSIAKYNAAKKEIYNNIKS